MTEPTEKLSIISALDPKTKRRRTRELARLYIVAAVLTIVFIIFVLPFAFPPKSNEHWEFLKMGLSGLMGILGSTVTFYFGHLGRD